MTATTPTPTPHLGVVMLDTRFPRLPGDIGNPASFDFPVSYQRVSGATVGAVVDTRPLATTLADAMLAAALALRARGVSMIATSCGFLAGLQPRLAEALDVPVLTSSLCLLPALRARHGVDAAIGVLSFSKTRLSPHHFGGDWDERLLIEGLDEDCHYARVIAEDRLELDREQAGRDVMAAAARLRARSPRLAAVVLECTNLGPWRDELAACLDAPVHDLVEALQAIAAAGR